MQVVIKFWYTSKEKKYTLHIKEKVFFFLQIKVIPKYFCGE